MPASAGPSGTSGGRGTFPERGESTRLAPAKVNIVLEVLGRRTDGFHELHSVFAPLTLADRLSVRVSRARARGAEADELVVSAADDVPVAGNLVLRAAALLREEARRPLPGLVFRLAKRVPAAAGLGGGSSDAMAALDLAAAAWGLHLAPRRRLELAAELGSDVPFFALGGWAEVRGRGERVRPLPAPAGPLGVLLLVSDARLSTAAVFAAFDARDTSAGRGGGGGTAAEAMTGRSRAPEDAGTAIGTTGTGPRARLGAASRVARMLRAGAAPAEIAATEPANDLAEAAFVLVPGLAELRSGVAGLLGRPVHLSGSGPALAVLYASPREARAAARAVGAARELVPPGGGLAIIPTSTAGGDA